MAAELNLIRPAFPAGTRAEILYNEANFIRSSINGVLKTLAEVSFSLSS